jgi:hypothetical protein
LFHGNREKCLLALSAVDNHFEIKRGISMKLFLSAIFVLFSVNTLAATNLRDFEGTYKLGKVTNTVQHRNCKSGLKIDVNGDQFDVYIQYATGFTQEASAIISKNHTYKMSDGKRVKSSAALTGNVLMYQEKTFNKWALNPKVVYKPISTEVARFNLVNDGSAITANMTWEMPYKGGYTDRLTQYCEYIRVSR